MYVTDSWSSAVPLFRKMNDRWLVSWMTASGQFISYICALCEENARALCNRSARQSHLVLTEDESSLDDKTFQVNHLKSELWVYLNGWIGGSVMRLCCHRCLSVRQHTACFTSTVFSQASLILPQWQQLLFADCFVLWMSQSGDILVCKENRDVTHLLLWWKRITQHNNISKDLSFKKSLNNK